MGKARYDPIIIRVPSDLVDTPDPWSPAPSARKQRTIDALNEAIDKGQRTWDVPKFGTYPMHKCAPRDTPKSGIERKVAEFVHSRGFNVEACGVWVPDLVNAGQRWKITPDIVVRNVAIEVDVDNYLSGVGTHLRGFPAHDMLRTDSLAAVGVRSIRVRIGFLEDVPGARNIKCEGSVSLSVLERLATVLSEELAL